MENLTLVDSAPSAEIEKSVSHPTNLYNNITRADLATFLERPVLVQKISWTGAPFAEFHIDPWAIMLNDPIIKSKLENYGRFRANLTIEFVINGTPFHYGRLGAFYYPNVQADTLPAAPTVFHLSQLPHVLMDPASSVRYSLTVPFSSPYHWIDLNEVLAAQIGVIFFADFNELRMSNSAVIDPVDVTVFGRFSDVELSVPSDLPVVVFTAQADDDEYGTGIISKPATAVVKFANYLVNIPFIGPFATATSIAAAATARIANMFGFSKPRQLEATVFVKQAPSSMFPSFSGTDTSVSLALDPKQELTIDNTIMALQPTDPLEIRAIAGIPGFFRAQTWAIADASGTNLFDFPVTPAMAAIINPLVLSSSIDHTPCSAVSQLFGKWSGTMKYHFQIIGSQYHRGRLRFSYIPGDITASFDPDVYNTNYTEIVDIQSTREFTFNVGYVSRAGFLSTTLCDFGTYAYDNTEHNGVVVVSVVNSLTAPLATADIQINCWMSMGDDLVFAAPQSLDPLLTYYDPEADDEYFVNEGVTRDLVPFQPRPGLNLAHYGEHIVSLRQLLHRDEFWGIVPLHNLNPGVNNQFTVFCNIPRYPLSPGLVPAGNLFWHQTSVAASYNFTRLIHLSYITPWFLGTRGSIRHKFMYPASNSGAAAGNSDDTVFATRYPWTVGKITAGGLSGSVGLIASVQADHFVTGTTAAGVVLSQTAEGTQFFKPNNQYMEIEQPDYNPLLYHPNPDRITIVDEVQEGTLVQTINGFVGTSPQYWGARHPRIFSSIGEDFSAQFFKGIPRMWVLTVQFAPSGTYTIPTTLT